MFPNNDVPDPLAAAFPKLNVDFAGGGPAGVVLAALLPNIDPGLGVPAGVVLMGSANADPFAGVDGAAFALPNKDVPGVPAGVVLVVPNADPLAGVFGNAVENADLAGVAVTFEVAVDGAPNGDDDVPFVLVFPKIEGVLDEPLAGAEGCAPKPNFTGCAAAVLDDEAAVLVEPKVKGFAGFDASDAGAWLDPEVDGVVVAAGLTPKLNFTGAGLLAAVEVDEAGAAGAAAGAAGLPNENAEAGAEGCEVVEEPAAFPLNPPIRASSEGPALVGAAAG